MTGGAGPRATERPSSTHPIAIEMWSVGLLVGAVFYLAYSVIRSRLLRAYYRPLELALITTVGAAVGHYGSLADSDDAFAWVWGAISGACIYILYAAVFRPLFTAVAVVLEVAVSMLLFAVLFQYFVGGTSDLDNRLVRGLVDLALYAIAAYTDRGP
jgi:hypothetical protein